MHLTPLKISLSSLPVIIYYAASVIANEHTPLPQGNQGIAAQFAGDHQIETHPEVIFVEQFNDDLEQLATRWHDLKRPDLFSLSADLPPGSAGTSSLMITHRGGDGTGAHLYRQLPPQPQTVHWRFYTKIDQNAAPLHHFSSENL